MPHKARPSAKVHKYKKDACRVDTENVVIRRRILRYKPRSLLEKQSSEAEVLDEEGPGDEVDFQEELEGAFTRLPVPINNKYYSANVNLWLNEMLPGLLLSSQKTKLHALIPALDAFMYIYDGHQVMTWARVAMCRGTHFS